MNDIAYDDDTAFATAPLLAALDAGTDEHASDYASNDIGLALRLQSLDAGT